MSSENSLIHALQQTWGGIHKGAPIQSINMERELQFYQKLFAIFQLGDCYFMIFNCVNQTIEYVHPAAYEIMGYPTELANYRILDVFDRIHPEDKAYFVRYQEEVTRFFMQLAPKDIQGYKVRYDYRMRKADGGYIRVLHQALTIEHDPDTGGVLRTLTLHTDINHLKPTGTPTLSFIGLEGRPSYLNIDIFGQPILLPTKLPFSRREMDVLRLVAQGYSSQEISNMLFLSKLTVDTHRKSLLRKANCNNTAELLHTASIEGWL